MVFAFGISLMSLMRIALVRSMLVSERGILAQHALVSKVVPVSLKIFRFGGSKAMPSSSMCRAHARSNSVIVRGNNATPRLVIFSHMVKISRSKLLGNEPQHSSVRCLAFGALKWVSVRGSRGMKSSVRFKATGMEIISSAVGRSAKSVISIVSNWGR